MKENYPKTFHELEEYINYLDRKFQKEINDILQEIYCGGID